MIRFRFAIRQGFSRFGLGRLVRPITQEYQSNQLLTNYLGIGSSKYRGEPSLTQNAISLRNGMVMTAGEALSQGDVVYISAADTIKQADDTAALRYKIIGVVNQAAANTEKVVVITSGPIEVTADEAITIGMLVMAASTKGRIKERTRTHTHTIPDHSAHTHTQGSTGSTQSSHTHNQGSTGSDSHTHTVGDTTSSLDLGHSHSQNTTNSGNGGPHTHTQPISVSNSDEHSHTNPNTGSDNHSHTNPATALGGVSHSHSNPTTASATLTHADTGVDVAFIPGSILGRALTAAASAGDKCVILVSLA